LQEKLKELDKMKTIKEIRKAVATLANRINRKERNLSNSFKRAWQIIKGKSLITKVSGVTFGNRQKALKHLSRYTRERINVMLVREYNNRFDDNAVKVIVNVDKGKDYKMGYLPRELAEEISVLIDKGFNISANYRTVTGGIFVNRLGCLIDIIF